MDTYTIGQRVSFEDMANPRRYGTVIEAGVGFNGSENRVAWDDGAESTSTMRQPGWRAEADGFDAWAAASGEVATTFTDGEEVVR